MRHRVRIQPYVSPDIHQRLRTYGAAQGLTESAIAEGAFGEYLARDAFRRRWWCGGWMA
jgi:hypothetical protein